MPSSIQKRWIVAPPIPPEAAQALQAYSPVMRSILYQRGYRDAEAARAYLEARLPESSRPQDMLGIPAAVERLEYALQHGESIAVYGDYDADGVTATALLTRALRSLGATVQGYIPNRFDEGYGLNTEALDTLREGGVSLVITVDCGIRSPVEAEHARRIGLDLIITDHHHPGDALPQAKAVINPKQPGDAYPDKNLAGVGLAYKLVQALVERLRPADFLAEDYLDLVALGTIADLVPLVGENRALVRAGLRAIRSPSRQGVMSLIGVAQLRPAQITAENVGFSLAPRLNAAGRLDSALAALNLLLTSDVSEAALLAQHLDNQSRERQQITREIQANAEQTILADDPQALLLFAVSEAYNPGVIGLAASRLTDIYYRPAIVATRGDELTRGSCRSIPEFHITHALDECAELLFRHGGHAAAAGFTVRNADLPELVQRLKAIAQRELTGQDLRPVLHADAETGLAALRVELLQEMERLQPTGQANPAAYLVSRRLKVLRSRTVGQDSNHLKLTVSDAGITYDAIAFRMGHWQQQMPPFVDLLYSFELNEYNGRSSLQLNVRDLKPSGADD